jgi:hypothetical protein
MDNFPDGCDGPPGDDVEHICEECGAIAAVGSSPDLLVCTECDWFKWMDES